MRHGDPLSITPSGVMARARGQPGESPSCNAWCLSRKITPCVTRPVLFAHCSQGGLHIPPRRSTPLGGMFVCPRKEINGYFLRGFSRKCPDVHYLALLCRGLSLTPCYCLRLESPSQWNHCGFVIWASGYSVWCIYCIYMLGCVLL